MAVHQDHQFDVEGYAGSALDEGDHFQSPQHGCVAPSQCHILIINFTIICIIPESDAEVKTFLDYFQILSIYLWINITNPLIIVFGV